MDPCPKAVTTHRETLTQCNFHTEHWVLTQESARLLAGPASYRTKYPSAQESTLKKTQTNPQRPETARGTARGGRKGLNTPSRPDGPRTSYRDQKPTAHCVTGWASGGEECQPHNPTTPNPKNPTTKKREWIIISCLKDSAISKYIIVF